MKTYVTVSYGDLSITKAVEVCKLSQELRSIAPYIVNTSNSAPIPQVSLGAVVRQSRRTGRCVPVTKPGVVTEKYIDACLASFHASLQH